jgi:esterase/lipase superfamily enzyme
MADFRPLLLLVLCIGLWACQPTVYLMPAPVGMQAEPDFELTPEDQRDSSIVVGYATNRLPSKKDSSPFFTKKFDQSLRFGLATVQIGREATTWDELRHLSADTRRKDKIKLVLTGIDHQAVLQEDDKLDELNPELQDMFARLNQLIDNNPIRDITVYVHGANSSFYRAAAQAAQYHHFTARGTAVIVYSWPSAEKLVRYRKDVENIEATVPAFVRFINLLARHSTAENINILAYSAGAQLATKSLAALGADIDPGEREDYRRQLRLANVYYAAADAEFEAFLPQLRNYVDLLDKATVTVNQQDSVLKLSQRFGSKKSRLGKPDLKEADDTDTKWAAQLSRTDALDIIYIDTEVIPDIDSDSHDYWYNNPWVSTDAMFLLNFHAPPKQRGLIKLDGASDSAERWTFPADYDVVVTQKLTQQLEQHFNQTQDVPEQ